MHILSVQSVLQIIVLSVWVIGQGQALDVAQEAEAEKSSSGLQAAETSLDSETAPRSARQYGDDLTRAKYGDIPCLLNGYECRSSSTPCCAGMACIYAGGLKSVCAASQAPQTYIPPPMTFQPKASILHPGQNVKEGIFGGLFSLG